MTKSIFSMVAIFAVVGDAAGGIRVGNLSKNYAGTYKNTLGLQQQYNDYINSMQADVPVEADLPIPVVDKNVAEQIKSGADGASTNIEALNECAKIYPGGEFVWDVPTLGRGAGGPATCVAVVEMRALTGTAGNEYTVAARGKLAAGDAFNCNISDFPSSSYLPDIANVIFPADSGPTREDVIRVLNEEQKNKAGLKIAAAAVVSGLAGNIVGKSEPGNDGLVGTNKEKLKTTAAGAAIGAALMTASTFSGKVAGDTILHAGVNAAAGGVVGNMSGYGDSVLRVEKCMYNGAETQCLWGRITKTSDTVEDVYYGVENKKIYRCTNDYTDCVQDNTWIIKNFYDSQDEPTIKLSELEGKDPTISNVLRSITTYGYNDITKSMEVNGEGTYYKASAAKRMGAPVPAVIVNFQDSMFGTKYSDWSRWVASNGKTAVLCLRNSQGDPYECNNAKDGTKPTYDISEFNPIMLEASDGDIVDFSNKARLGATVKGAGIGGALGGFSGYQGAQKDIEDRFVQASREYTDSLEKFYCGTGTKFLSFYNDEVIIPTMKK